MLFLAMSCLQGRAMNDAADSLLALGVGGLQLTPGCAPSEGFCERLADEGVVTRTHHGFSPHALRQRVWSRDGSLVARSDSIHPPKSNCAEEFFAAAEAGTLTGQIIEVMYPGYTLGWAGEVHRAMDLGLELAVDVSHVFISLTQGSLDEACVRRLFAYERISEIHVSANDGRVDRHARISQDSYGLGFARERSGDAVPVVFESYLHRLSFDERREQVDLVVGAVS